MMAGKETFTVVDDRLLRGLKQLNDLLPVALFITQPNPEVQIY